MKVIIGTSQPSPILDELLKLEQEGSLTLARVENDGSTNDDISDAEVLLRRFWYGETLDKLVAAAPSLRWLHTPMAGVDLILTPQIMERDIIVTNAAGIHAEPMAEWVLLVMLSIVKEYPMFLEHQQKRVWWRPDNLARFRFRELTGKSLLIIGAGQIGSAVARRATTFNMHIWGSRRSRKPAHHFERMYGEDDWRAALPETDFVLLTLPLTPKTRNIIGKNEIDAMKEGAWLMNVARGAVVDEAALLEALHGGKLGGAWIDTPVEEPLPTESPLWSAPNAIITPHVTWMSEYTHIRAADLFIKNLHCYMRGEPLVNVVDKHAGY